MKENQRYKNEQLKHVLNLNQLAYFYIHGITTSVPILLILKQISEYFRTLDTQIRNSF